MGKVTTFPRAYTAMRRRWTGRSIPTKLTPMKERSGFSSLALLAVFAGFTCHVGGAMAQEADCYDADVSARIVSQIPTVFPNDDDGWITISWPWIVDLDVSRVYSGEARRGRMSVLAVLHTYYRRDLGSRRWKLRRNDLGGFNLLRGAENLRVRCAADQPPATAYIKPPDGQTLEDLRREGLKHYGRDN